MKTCHSKYHAVKCELNGEHFDSLREMRRWQELKILERAGEIHDVMRQVPFELIPAQRDPDTCKVIEHSVVYRADFCYTTKEGKFVVEDAKGMRTPAYVIKRKLMLYVHRIRITEV